MDIIAFLLKLIAAIVVAAGVLFAIFSLWGWEKAWSAMFGSPDLGQVEFEDLKKRRRPNQALICPPDLCDAASVDAESPVYALPAQRLREEVLKIALQESSIDQVDDGTDPQKLRFVQRSPRMRFPDTINVAIIPLDDSTSTFAYYARAQIGKTDFGVNLQRGRRWLARLKEFER